MLTELFKRIDYNKLYPPFFIKLQQLTEKCRIRGVDYYAISGFRDWKEQDELYAKGRDKRGKIIDKSKIVTKAKGGQSNHNFTVACDFSKDGDMKRIGLQPDWNIEGYKILAEEAQYLGLEAGLYWKSIDGPHIQLNLERNGLSFKDLQEIYLKENGGMAAVWCLLDSYTW